MRALIADDDGVSRLLLESLLAEWGYEVVEVQNGREAWQILQREDAPPLAILDWRMPGMDGVEVCRQVRQTSRAPYVYLIMLTANTDRHHIIQALEAGADDYVGKPFDEQELRVRLLAGKRIVELQQALWLQATRDALTGLWNRGMILDLLQRELARAARQDIAVGVILADLDRFKHINDTYGHLAGDAVLREVAQRLGSVLRPYDVLGRYGGEELLVVLPGCRTSGIASVAERLRHCIAAAPVVTATGTIAVSISLGAATGSGPGLEADRLIQCADEALYRAKRGGRNRVELAPHCQGQAA